MGALAEGCFEERVPGPAIGVFEWLMEELDALGRPEESPDSVAAAGTAGTPPSVAAPRSVAGCDAWVAGLMASELLIRRLQASQMRSLVAAAEAMPVARRRGAQGGQEPEGRRRRNMRSGSANQKCEGGESSGEGLEDGEGQHLPEAEGHDDAEHRCRAEDCCGLKIVAGLSGTVKQEGARGLEVEARSRVQRA